MKASNLTTANLTPASIHFTHTGNFTAVWLNPAPNPFLFQLQGYRR